MLRGGGRTCFILSGARSKDLTTEDVSENASKECILGQCYSGNFLENSTVARHSPTMGGIINAYDLEHYKENNWRLETTQLNNAQINNGFVPKGKL